METQTKKLKILVKFPSRGRPDQFIASVKSIHTHFLDKENYRILASFDLDDSLYTNVDFLKRIKSELTGVPLNIVYGTSKSKIDAVNRDIKQYNYDWDVLVVFSDDMFMVSDGMDEFIREKFAIHFHTLDGNLHLNDGYTQNLISTMIVMGRKYYDRLGYAYYTKYKSFCCDNEYTERAYGEGKMVYFPEIFYKHEHPANNGNIKSDELYQHNDKFWQEDHELLEYRRRFNFKD